MQDLHMTMRERCKQSFRNYYAVTQEERLDLMEELGPNALLLFEYYLRMASIGNVDLSDENSAKYFGWAESTSYRWRRALINKGFVHVDKFTHPQTKQTVTVTYLGKEEVFKHRSGL